MNIKINRDALLKPLANVTSIVERKHALPILSNILILFFGLITFDLKIVFFFNNYFKTN